MIEATESDFSPPLSDNPADHEGTLLLPVGNHINAALVAAGWAMNHLQFFETVVMQMPAERTAILDTLASAQRAIEDAALHYQSACEVATCKGQA